MDIPNIGPRGIRTRRRLAVTAFASGAVLVGALVMAGAARPWRLAVLPFFWLGALGWFQAREKT
jgi:hypothetical protein